MTTATHASCSLDARAVQPLDNPSLTRKMKNRTELQAADLYVLLQREFRRRQSPQCTQCFVQLPYRVDRNGDDDGANWEVAIPPRCAQGCADLIEDLVQEFRALYDLRPESGH